MITRARKNLFPAIDGSRSFSIRHTAVGIAADASPRLPATARIPTVGRIGRTPYPSLAAPR